MINNRQNGRRGRGRGNGMRPMNGGGGGGGNQDRGNRIDNRARGNANQLHEKYKTLARDAQMQGDRVMTEYYLQFADHYFRVLGETRGRFEEQRRQRGDFQDDYEGDEGEGELNAADAVDQGYEERAPRREAREPREGEGQSRANGERQPRFERRERQSRDENYGNRAEERQPVEAPRQLSLVEEQGPPEGGEGEEKPVRRRGRPRRERPEESESSSRIDGDRPLPAFLAEPASAEAAPAAEPVAEEAPRKRRVTRKPRAEAADTVSAEA